LQSKIIQVAGLGFTIAYAAFIVWIYATEPRTFKEVTTSAEVAAGTYEINQETSTQLSAFSGASSFVRLATNGSAQIRRSEMPAHSSTSRIRFTAKVGAAFILIRSYSSKVWRR